MAAAIALDRERRPGHATPLALAVWAYAGWVVASGFLGPVYTPAALFHPLFLLAGFALTRGGAQARERSFGALAAGALALALWGLWQSATGQGRAAALLETPNTLASVLGLVLAPLLVRLAYRQGARRIVFLAIILAAGLTATLSRGGFIALAAGLLVALLVVAERPDRAGVSRVLFVLSAGGALGAAAISLPGWLAAQPLPPQASLAGVAETLPASLGSRAELYRLALSALGEHPWLGAGYLGFRALLEAHRAEVPSYATENITYFVHDDYLQTLIELGLPGLAALLAVVLLPFWLARRSRVSQAGRLHVRAPLAGLAVMAVHALGDFPFYVPLCLLGFGALLGEVDARLASGSRSPAAAGMPARLARIAAAAAAAVVLVPPALAEAAAAYGNRSWRAGEAQAAAYGFELARRLQARDWRYPWYAGQFWHAQALSGNPAAPRLADAAFAAAIAANPREPRPLLARLATQLRFARLLDHPQPAATLRGWADRALALAPLNPAVRRDHAAALDRLARGR